MGAGKMFSGSRLGVGRALGLMVIGIAGVSAALAQPAGAPVSAPASAPASAPGVAPASGGALPAARAPSAPGSKAAHKPKSATVKLTFRSSPGGASVYYGKRMLGTTPFDTDWKRDSGPVDVAVRMGGYYTVNSRVYTGRDDTLSVKLTRLRDGHSIYGYKAPLKDAGVPVGGGSEDAPD